MAGTPEGAERDQLRRHYEIERELANRLRGASKAERRTLYSEVYEELLRRVELVGNREAQKAQVGLLLALLGPFVEGRSTFLEIGAGSCELSLELARTLDRVWAVDAVEPSLPREAVPEGFRFVPAGMVREIVPPASVDVALSCHFVEHLHPDDLQDHLGEVRDLLTGGGAYLVVTPNRIYGPHDISRTFSDRAEGLHLREYTHRDLARELRRAGFVDVGVVGRLGEPAKSGRLGPIGVLEGLLDGLPGRWRRAVISRAPRQAPFRPLEQVKLVGFKAGTSGGRP